MSSSVLPDGLRAVLDAVLPGADLTGVAVASGGFHTVVLLPGTAAVRVARTAAAAAELPRRTELSRRLAAAGLPFAVPRPLGEVVTAGGRTAVAMSWLDGVRHPKGEGDPRQLAAVLEALAAVDLAPLSGVLGVPHEYAGRERWEELMTGEVADRLPSAWRAEALDRIRAVLELPPVRPSLTHGDLAGDNMRWDARGRLTGVMDWDLAAAWDPAVDAACLAWHGWPAVRAAVPPATYRRARAWYRTFGLEQIAYGVLSEAPGAELTTAVERTVAWLERTRDAPA